MTELSEKCTIVLSQPLSKDVCYDFRKIRQWVMCKTWDTMEKEKISFKSAIRKSWSEAKKVCVD
jgi:hypothetical protein